MRSLLNKNWKFFMVGKNDFSKKVLALLAKKGIEVVSSTAVPAFEGDKYFTGTAYVLVWNETQFLRDYRQVETLAKSSWCPKEYFNSKAA
jgi:hypothetical protein